MCVCHIFTLWVSVEKRIFFLLTFSLWPHTRISVFFLFALNVILNRIFRKDMMIWKKKSYVNTFTKCVGTRTFVYFQAHVGNIFVFNCLRCCATCKKQTELVSGAAWHKRLLRWQAFCIVRFFICYVRLLYIVCIEKKLNARKIFLNRSIPNQLIRWSKEKSLGYFLCY